MKSLALLSAFMFSFFGLPSNDILQRDRITSDRDKGEFYMELASKYAPDAYHILSSCENFSKFTVYAKEANSRIELLDQWNTVVHETAHGYDFRLANYGEKAYFLGDGIVIKMPKGKLYNTHELASSIPSATRQSIMRFDPYITGASPNLSSQVSGIYGLLEEMTAYYHGTKASVDTYEYFRSFCPDKNFECWGKGYLEDPATTLSALYEFRLFIAWYLDYAEKHHRDVYKATMNNRPLRTVYTLVDQKFEALILEFEQIRNDQMKLMTEAGTLVFMSEDGFLMHRRSDGSAYGTGTFALYNQKVQDLMSERLQQQLDDFKVQGLTSDNYEMFLAGE